MPRHTWRFFTKLAAAASAVSLLSGPVVAGAEPAAATVHVVEPGETLSLIADSLGVDAATVAKLNSLDDPNFVVVGQSLKLPSKSAPAPAALQAPPQRTYTVAEGDTLWSIAQRFGMTADALAQANTLDDPDRIVVGVHLLVASSAAAASSAPSPAPATRPPTTAPTPPPRRSLVVSYVVQAGETLSQIAHQFDVRPDAVVQASGLEDPNKLSIGTVLKVTVPGREHVVTAGETLRDIALQEKVDLGSLVDFNQLDDPELIRVGQVVLVPAAANQRPPAASTIVAAAVPAATAPPPPAVAPPPAAAPSPASAARVATKPPAAPVAVVAAPRGAPSDGLAGAGLKLLGSPYAWGGSSPSGFDCSGFVWYVARQVGKPISRGMLGEYNSGSHPGRDELKPGDLVFFQSTYSPGLSHNGIYIGNSQFVHAVDEAAGVTISSLNTPYWSSHWFGATRLP